MSGMRSGELFAGVGGLGMAVDEVFGTTPAWVCEFDPAPSKALAFHHPGVPNYGDVTKVDFTAVPHTRVRQGGFPCQDVSLAGRRRGMSGGTRSGLWSEFLRSIEEDRPEWVVIENVRGLLSAEGEPWHDDLIEAHAEMKRLDGLVEMAEKFAAGNPAGRKEGRAAYARRWKFAAIRVARHRDRAVARFKRERRLVQRAIAIVLRGLADLGFDAEWTGIRASDIGAPHGRFRVFILAWPAENTRRGGSGRRAEGQEPSRGDDASVGSDQGRDGGRADQRLTCTACGEPLAPTRADVFDGTWCDCSVKLFSTPDTVPDAPNTGSNSHKAGNVVGLGNQVMSLLPTPGAYDGERGGSQHPDKRRDGGHTVTLQDVAEHLQLLPTPVAQPSGNTPEEHLRKKPGREVVTDLAIIAENGLIESGGRLMPTPRASRGGSATETMYGLGAERVDDERPQGQVVADVTDWGPYEAAIRRWEAIIGRPAPAPVRFDGKGGKPRLNPELTEWMMGWPAGHVTNPAIGLTRAEQLKACGNGVVPQQAVAALREMLARPGVPPIRYALAA